MTNRSVVLLSGEATSIPQAEAKALFLSYDPDSKFSAPEKRILIAESATDPVTVSSRIAFAKRVGLLVEEPLEVQDLVRGKRIRLRTFDLAKQSSEIDPGTVLRGIDVTIDLREPEYEFSVIRGEKQYMALTRPLMMHQSWSTRRPRKRPFFHPSAIFPKLSRALVNLTMCKEGGLFLDPFAGTGSLPLEAGEIGMRVVASDSASSMVKGALLNMKNFGQGWLGVIRADASSVPITAVDSIATDVPYGRASSTRGAIAKDVIQSAMSELPKVLRAGSRMVLMHPKGLTAESTELVSLEEELDIYVHKLLTRTISIFRRR